MSLSIHSSMVVAGRWLGRLSALALASLLVIASPSAARAEMTSIVIDHGTGEVLVDDNADKANYPASLTKMMTLYLTFQALESGKIKPHTRFKVSSRAARMPPSKLGVPAGSLISVDDAIQALAVKSANDVAVTVAENLGGSEPRFAQLMTRQARHLGMRQTHFANASGLPNDLQRTTARDMAILSRRLINDFPQYYHYFGAPTFAWRTRTHHNHNRLMFRYDGMDGLKTGYINASGYNLAASAVRDGRRLVGVVLGGPTSGARNEEMARALDTGFATPSRGKGPVMAMASQAEKVLDEVEIELPEIPAVALVEEEEPVARRAVTSTRPARAKATAVAPKIQRAAFTVQLGAFSDRGHAMKVAQLAKRKTKALRNGDVGVNASRARKNVFVAQVVGLGRNDAEAACSWLRRQRQPCIVLRQNDGVIGSQ